MRRRKVVPAPDRARAGKWTKAIPVGDGKYRTFTCSTKTAANKAAQAWLEANGGKVTTIGTTSLTVAHLVRQFVNRYEATKVKTGARKPNSLAVLRLCERKIALDPIGRMPVGKVQPRDVDAMVARMLEGGYSRQHKISPRYAQLCRALLGRAGLRALWCLTLSR